MTSFIIIATVVNILPSWFFTLQNMTIVRLFFFLLVAEFVCKD